MQWTWEGGIAERSTDDGATCHVARDGLEYTPWGGGRNHYYLPDAVRATLDLDLVFRGLISVASAPHGDRRIQSLNGGLNWEIVANFSWAAEVAVHPRRPRTLYVLQGDHTVLTSEDAGATWRVLRGPVPFGHPCAHALTNWAAGLAVVPPDGDTALSGTEQDGVFRSDDGGETWASANRGLHFAYVTHITVDQGRNRVYASNWSGILRSDDDARTWAACG